MAKMNFGTGLASLLTGVAQGGTYNAQQEYAQEQRDKEQQKMHQQRLDDAETERTRKNDEQQAQLLAEQGQRNKDIDQISSLLGDPSQPFSSDMIRKASEYDTKYNRNISPVLNTITENLQGQPYLEVNNPNMKGMIPNPNYVPKYTDKRAVRHEINKVNNETTEILQKFDPNTDQPQIGNDGKPIEERGKSWKTTELNPHYVKGGGSSPYQLPKTTASQVFTLGKKFTDLKSKATQFSTALSSNPSSIQAFNQEAKRLQAIPDSIKDEEIKATQAKYPNLNDEQARLIAIKEKAAKNLSDRAWLKVSEERQHFDDFITPLIAAHPQADEFLQAQYDNAKGTPDKDNYWNDVVDGYKNGTLDNHAVNLLAQKYLAMYGQFPDKMAYNANTKEREIVEPKDTKTTKTAEPKKTIKAKPQPKGKIDKATAMKYVTKAGGDKDKARQMAKDDGYTF